MSMPILTPEVAGMLEIHAIINNETISPDLAVGDALQEENYETDESAVVLVSRRILKAGQGEVFVPLKPILLETDKFPEGHCLRLLKRDMEASICLGVQATQWELVSLLKNQLGFLKLAAEGKELPGDISEIAHLGEAASKKVLPISLFAKSMRFLRAIYKDRASVHRNLIASFFVSGVSRNGNIIKNYDVGNFVRLLGEPSKNSGNTTPFLEAALAKEVAEELRMQEKSILASHIRVVGGYLASIDKMFSKCLKKIETHLETSSESNLCTAQLAEWDNYLQRQFSKFLLTANTKFNENGLRFGPKLPYLTAHPSPGVKDAFGNEIAQLASMSPFLSNLDYASLQPQSI